MLKTKTYDRLKKTPTHAEPRSANKKRARGFPGPLPISIDGDYFIMNKLAFLVTSAPFRSNVAVYI